MIKTYLIRLSVLLTIVVNSHLTYGQGTGKIEYPSLGLSFEIPETWLGQEGDGLYLMGHETIPGILLIIPHSTPLTVESMIAESNKGLSFGNGTVLRPVTSLSTISVSDIAGEFEGTFENYPAMAYIIGMSNSLGNGITIVAITTPDAFDASIYKNLAMDIRSSVVFTAIENKPSIGGTSKSASIQDWNYQLGDTKLTFMESYYSGGDNGGGYSMKEEIHLCKAGFFLHYGQNLVAAGGSDVSGYSGSSSKGHGTWQITERNAVAYLLLSFNDGSTREYKLEWVEDTKLYLNGYRYYRTWEGDYAPDCFR